MKLPTVAIVALLVLLTLEYVQPDRAGAAVSNLYATQACVGSRVSVGFTWYRDSPQAREVWLDLSQRSNTFASGTFTSFGPIDPGRNFYTVNPGSNDRVYARVNQYLSDGRWDPSPVYYIDLMRCQASSSSNTVPYVPPEDPPCYFSPYEPPPDGPTRYSPNDVPGPCDVPNVQYNEHN